MDTDGSRSFLSHFIHSLTAAEPAAQSNGVIWLFVLFLIFVIGGAYFGGSESAFSAMNKIRIKAKADDGNKRAKNVMYISNNFDKALTTLLIGNNITHIAAASVATLIATRLFGASDQVTLICTIVTTLIVFLFSEMIPKSFANDRSETTALFAAKSLRFLMKILSPLSAFFTMISSGVTKLINHFVKHKEEPSITEEELYQIIDTIEEEGVVNEEQGDMLKSAMGFSQTIAQDVMTMRNDIYAVDASLSNQKILAIVQETKFTRLPVYEGSLDNVVGILHMRVFLRAYLKNPNVDIHSLLMPVYRVSPNAKIDELMTEMRQHKFYLAVVTDEGGHTLGLLTIEDFVEELVGEIWDEDDEVDENFLNLGGNRFCINTHMTLGEACERMGTRCPQRQMNNRPILTLLLERFGRVPEEEESIVYYHMEITVDKVENNRVENVIIHLQSEKDRKASHKTATSAASAR